MNEFGQALHRLRREHDPSLSLRALGARVNYSHVYLWQIEKGRVPVTPDLAKGLDEALGAAGELVALAEDEVSERIRAGLDAHADRIVVVPETVQALTAARSRYEHMYRLVGGVAVRPRLLEYVRKHASPLLDRGTWDRATGGRLYHAVGGLTALVGVCAYDADEQAAAVRHYREALRLARASGDRAFTGYVVSLLATQAVRAGNPVEALEHANGALAAPRGLTPALLADLHCIRAEAHAARGDAWESGRYIDQAYEASARIDMHEEPSETGHVQPGVVQGRHAEVLRTLGEYAKADDRARASLTGTPATHPRGRANRIAVLTKVLISNGDLDEAATTGMQMIDLAQQMESELFRRRVETTWRSLQARRRATATVADFCERAELLLHTPL